jgi:hypothetical protein
MKKLIISLIAFSFSTLVLANNGREYKIELKDANLTGASVETLDSLVSYLESNRDAEVVIISKMISSNPSSNLLMAKEAATNAFSYLIMEGVDIDQVSFKVLGTTLMRETNDAKVELTCDINH